MRSNRDAVNPQLRNNRAVEPPYTFAQISDIAINREVLRIYDNACKETRMVYDLGHDTKGVEIENWVIRWMLWHVFRYRRSARSKSAMDTVANYNVQLPPKAD